MTLYKCAKGCADPKNGRRLWHRGKWACPHEPEYDASRVQREDALKRQVAEARARYSRPSDSSPGSVSSPPSNSGLAPASPAKAPETVEIAGGGVADVIVRGETRPAEGTDWLLSPEDSRTLIGFIFSLVGRVVHLGDRILEVERAPANLFVLTPADEANAGMGFGQRLSTKIVKGLGARTLQEGHETVQSLAGANLFAGLFLGVAEHVWDKWRRSPVLARRKAKIAEMRRQRAERMEVGRTPSPEIPAPA